MKYLALSLSLLHLSVFALDRNVHYEGDPRAQLFESIHAITGQPMAQRVDLTVSGQEPLEIKRIFTGETGDGWEFFPQTALLETVRRDRRKTTLTVTLSSGAQLKFQSKSLNKTPLFVLKSDGSLKGVTNTAHGEISGRTNVKNTRVEKDKEHNVYIVNLADGTRRYYGRADEVKKVKDRRKICSTFKLIREERPNGNQIHYIYDKFMRPKKIWSTSPSGEITYATMEFQYVSIPPLDPGFTVTGSDGQEITYKYQAHHPESLEKLAYYLSEIRQGEMSADVIFYKKVQKGTPPKMCAQSQEFCRYQAYDFYRKGENQIGEKLIPIRTSKDQKIGKVATLGAPTSFDGDVKPFAHFIYKSNESIPTYGGESKGTTEVVHCANERVVYLHDREQRPLRIETYLDDRLHKAESFVWGKGPYLGQLLCHVFEGKTGPIKATTYQYDGAGNVVIETIWGAVTGKGLCPLLLDEQGMPIDNGVDRQVTKREFNERNLLKVAEYPNGLKEQTAYLKGTDLPLSVFTFLKGEVIKREFYIYDRENRLVREVLDDGTHRNMMDLSDVKLRRILSYSGDLQIQWIDESYYDEATDSEILLRRTCLENNVKGHLVKKDIFDADNTLIASWAYERDHMGRVTKELDPLGCTKTFKYDPYGNLIESTDGAGHQMVASYDCIDREIERRHVTPSGEVETFETSYNLKDRTKVVTNDQGDQTTTTYDLEGHIVGLTRPLQTLADGSAQRPHRTYRYDALSNLSQEIDELGNVTEYVRNIFGDPLKIFHSNGLCETFEYNLYGQLIAHTDREGVVTLTEYDHFGRLLKTTYADGACESNSYSTFNKRVATDIHGSLTHYLYNGAGELLIEEGERFQKEYARNALGHTVKEVTQADGGLKRISIFKRDPMGRILEKRELNEAHELISFSEVDATLTHDEIGERGVLNKETFYDLKGNLAKEVITYEGYEHTPKITLYQRDICGRVIKRTEWAGTDCERVYEMGYTPNGHLEQLKKPDGHTLFATYDVRGRMVTLKCTDETIDYAFEYETFDQPTLLHDRLAKTTTVRTFDSQGNLTGETLATGHTFASTYNGYQQKTRLTLPDETAVSYLYDEYFLRSIIRESPINHYVHHFDTYNLDKQATDETFMYGIKGLTRTFSSSKEPIAFETPFVQQTRDLTNHTRELIVDFKHLNSSYTYDEMGSLIEEEGVSNAFYRYDAVGNRVEKNGETYVLNTDFTLQSVGQTHFVYNRNGQLIERANPDGVTRFTYDGLGRLVAINAPKSNIQYIYDPLGRIVTKRVAHLVGTSWKEKPKVDFLYDDRDEIGLMQEGQIVQLRLLPPGEGESRQPVAFEILRRPYIPITTIEGELIALADPESRANSYTFMISPFGESRGLLPIKHLWLYRSYRYDSDAALYHQNGHFYDPATGKMLATPMKEFNVNN